MGCCNARWASLANHLLICMISALLAIPIAIGSPSPAQSTPAQTSPARTTTPPAFEVVTIKQVDANNSHPPSVMISGDRFVATGMSLKELIKIAYDMNYGADQQLSGGAAWIGLDRFDVEAKLDAAVSERLHQLTSKERGQELRQMLRQMLADRFKLQVHHGSSQLPMYELVIAKGGSKLMPAVPQLSATHQDQADRPNIRFAGKGVLEGNGADSETLVTALSMQPDIGGRLVVDKTGLTGKYDFTLSWSPVSLQSVEATGTDPGPSLFTALQEQLGLRLAATKGTVDIIVIDHVELPSAN